ncbi:MAG: iron-containing alcohol dehydrogenase [Promicromonosporaceae bacterium]|nr:iron-containing alcohol dehydrogenase [Promicromonosporaceae bacterium]
MHFAVVLGSFDTLNHRAVKSLLPVWVLLDHSYLASLPYHHKASAMLDALCQGIESYWSVKSTPESKVYARAAIESVLKHAVDYLAFGGSDSVSVAAASSSGSSKRHDGETHSGPTDGQCEPPANGEMAILRAANLGGKAINQTQTTAPHAMSYKLARVGPPPRRCCALSSKWGSGVKECFRNPCSDAETPL